VPSRRSAGESASTADKERSHSQTPLAKSAETEALIEDQALRSRGGFRSVQDEEFENPTVTTQPGLFRCLWSNYYFEPHSHDLESDSGTVEGDPIQLNLGHTR